MLLPGLVMMRELRRLLAAGGLPPADKRTPEDWARIAGFRVLEELLRLLDDYRRLIERGVRCRLIERAHVREVGRMVIEIVLEVQP